MDDPLETRSKTIKVNDFQEPLPSCKVQNKIICLLIQGLNVWFKLSDENKAKPCTPQTLSKRAKRGEALLPGPVVVNCTNK